MKDFFWGLQLFESERAQTGRLANQGKNALGASCILLAHEILILRRAWIMTQLLQKARLFTSIALKMERSFMCDLFNRRSLRDDGRKDDEWMMEPWWCSDEASRKPETIASVVVVVVAVFVGGCLFVCLFICLFSCCYLPPFLNRQLDPMLRWPALFHLADVVGRRTFRTRIRNRI